MNHDGTVTELFQLRIAVKQGSNRYFVNCYGKIRSFETVEVIYLRHPYINGTGVRLP